MMQDRFDKLMKFLRELERAHIYFKLARYRDEAICVEIALPAERWEVDFMEDGRVEVERFRSIGPMQDESAFAELFALCSDEEAPASHDAARP